MSQEHWVMVALTAAMILIMLGVALTSSPRSRWYRWTRRVFWTLALLAVGGSLGGAGLNAVNLCAVLLLGPPGYGALLAISAL